MENSTPLNYVQKSELSEAEIDYCAQAMAHSEPWITLGLGFESAKNVLGQKDRAKFLALSQDQIAGFAIVVTRGPLAAYLQTLCIIDKFRSLGVGRSLMKYVEDEMFSSNPNLFLMVSDFNAPARKFYKAMGFREIGEIPDYFLSGKAEILMRKTRGPIRGYKKSEGTK